jgi:sugar O-acyltransferase (sialic acid O-acetyltransferase NeuD family)
MVIEEVEDMEPASVIVVGASSFGRQIAQYLVDGGRRVAGYLDDDPLARPGGGYDILGTTGSYVPDDSHEVLIAVSKPAHRKAIAEQLLARGAVLHTFVHPTAYVAGDAEIGEGSIVCPFSHIGSGARLGRNVLVNTHTLVGHDVRIGPHSALMHACINGGSSLGEGVFAGTYAAVNPNRSVGSWSRIAAGSVVYKDMGDRVLVSGNPAKAGPLLSQDPHSATSGGQDG